jgi:hypothetical protein
MPAVKCVCPRCHALQPSVPRPPATTSCPRCGARFTVTAAGTTLVLPQGPQTPPPARGKPALSALAPTRLELPADRVPVPPRPGRGLDRFPWLYVGLGFLSLLVVIGCAWAVVAHVRWQPQPEPLATSGPHPAEAANLAPQPEPAPRPTAAAKPATPPVSSPPSPAPAEAPEPRKDPLAGYVPPSSAEGGPWAGSLSKADQERVNRAIDRGVAWLKRRLERRGEGMAGRQGGQALAGLTLLACGVPARDPVVREIAEKVREGADNEGRTYDLALSILFLDRLGDPHDVEVIRTLAVRLVAGQNEDGGWTYNCPVVRSPEREDLLDLLASLAPARARRWSPQRTAKSTDGRLAFPPDMYLRIGPDNGTESGIEPGPARTKAKEPTPRPTPKPRRGDRKKLPANLKNLPVVKFTPGDKLRRNRGGSDNSNTQFALMGVWVARKYDLPLDRTLAMVGARFRSTQNSDGSWGYHPRTEQWPDSMTCSGLLGLAASRGSSAKKDSSRDQDVTRALRFLGSRIGNENGRAARGSGRLIGADAHGDLYFLWSVERVAVAYDLHKIEGKDWYGWGARLLVDHQHPEGSWQDTFEPLIDTCFALLFLKRANVAEDLTATLRRLGSGAGPQRTTSPAGERTSDEAPGRVVPNKAPPPPGKGEGG